MNEPWGNHGRRAVALGHSTDNQGLSSAGFRTAHGADGGGDWTGAAIRCPADAHEVVIGPTGAGKTVARMAPLLLEHPGPALALDLKAELFHITARARREMGQQVLLIDPFGIVPGEPAARFDPAQQIAAAEDPLDTALILAEALNSDRALLPDPFWERTANRLNAAGLCHMTTAPDLFDTETATPLAAWYDMLNGGDVAVTLHRELACNVRMRGDVRSVFQSFVQLPDSTRGGVLGTAQTAMRLFGQAAVRRAVDGADVRLADLAGRQDWTIYVAMPPKAVPAFAPLLRLWFEMILNTLLDRQSIPADPALVLVDEAGSVGRIPALELCFNLGRGYGIKAVTAFQTQHQLARVYGEAHRDIADNAGVISVFRPSHFRAAQDLSDLIGHVPPTRLMNLPAGHFVASIAGRMPQVLGCRSYLTDPELARRADPNPRHVPSP